MTTYTQSASLKAEIEAMRRIEAAVADLPPRTRKRVIARMVEEYLPEGESDGAAGDTAP